MNQEIKLPQLRSKLISYINNIMDKTIEDKLNESINRREEMTRENIIKAQQIGFKDVPEGIVVADQYGFIPEKKK